MGVFDLLSKEGRAKSAMDRSIKRVVNKYAQSPDRFAAMEKLRDLGTEDALYGLTRRWTMSYDKTIEDEQEKEWVHDTLVAMGERAIAPLRRFLLESDRLSYALRALEKTAPPGKVLEITDELLQREEPGYTRDPGKRLQILTWIGEWKGAGAAEISKRVVPYLQDFDETVRFTAVDTLAHHPDEATARVPLLDALVRHEEESRRIKVRIAELLAAQGWIVTSHKEAVSKLLGSELPEFGMQHEKLVPRKK